MVASANRATRGARGRGGWVPRTVVITGASAGVGRAVVRAAAGSGLNVGLIARSRERLQAAENEARRLSGGAAVASYVADVADAEQIEAAAEHFERTLGPIDAWVNNAMVSVFAPSWNITPDEFRRVTEVTYLGVVNGTQAALRRMRPRGVGSIVQVGSALAYRGIPLQSAYCAAKHAVVGYTDSVRAELLNEGSGINVCLVQLPALNTPQFEWVLSKVPNKPQPVPPIYQPEVAARAILESLTSGQREVYVGFPTVRAIWGNKLLPEYADRVLADSAFDDQQTDEPGDGARDSNLWSPVEGDYGAHGRFDDRSLDDGMIVRTTRLRANILISAAFGVGIVTGYPLFKRICRRLGGSYVQADRQLRHHR